MTELQESEARYRKQVSQVAEIRRQILAKTGVLVSHSKAWQVWRRLKDKRTLHGGHTL